MLKFTEMKTFFTKYLFLFFLIPFLIIVSAVLFATGSADVADLTMPVEETSAGFLWGSALSNGLLFWATALVYLVVYLIMFLIRKKTVFKWSALHFLIYILSFVLLSVDAENILILPFNVVSMVFFILNLSKKSHSGLLPKI